MQEQHAMAWRRRPWCHAFHFLRWVVLALTFYEPVAQSVSQAQSSFPDTKARGRVTVPSEFSPPPSVSSAHATADFVEVANRILPSVVAVSCKRVFPVHEMNRAREFKPRDDDRAPQPRPELQQRSSGAGVIISADGHILTNTHVVEFAENLTVRLYDQRTFPAQLLGADPHSEIAVLKIVATQLQPAALGNSETTQVGEWVLAVGNPLDLHFSVTAGIISAKGRQINVIQENFGVEHFLQTDAAINPGNSGGGLFNRRGEIIGVITAIATETGYDVGLGFAVPINLAMRIATDLMQTGKVVRGYLGVMLRPVGELEARALGLAAPAGVFIDDLYEDSPARAAGLQPADVILTIDGVAVRQTNELQAIIAGKTPGTFITLEVFREQRVLRLRVQLGELRGQQGRVASPLRRPAFVNLGIQAGDLTAFEALSLKQPWRAGAKVTAVERGSPAAEAGLLVGDIIVAINRQPVENAAAFLTQLRRCATGTAVMLAVVRDDGLYHLFLEAL